jgi:hypothetical protein
MAIAREGIDDRPEIGGTRPGLPVAAVAASLREYARARMLL